MATQAIKWGLLNYSALHQNFLNHHLQPTAMASEYLIFRPENAGPLKLLYFLLIDPNLCNADFVDTNTTTDDQNRSITDRLFIVAVILYLKLASAASSIYITIVGGLEYVFNLVSLNGGVLGLIWNTITGSIVNPNPDDAAYRSVRSFISGRDYSANKEIAAIMKNYYATVDDLEVGADGSMPLTVAIMASNLAYENESRVEDVVNNQWGMTFVEFFDCWNFFIKAKSTHAFVFCDKASDARVIVVAFRGTEDLDGWMTDLNFSWIDTKIMGSTHVGFMKALGLQNEKNFAESFPSQYSGDEPLAYYSITERLDDLVKKNENAKIVVTGHSLGGALSVLYASLLSDLRPDIFDRISDVLTFGQPRVGDQTFVEYIEPKLGKRYRRMSYRYDIVHRVPLACPISQRTFNHFGIATQYYGWYKGENVENIPNPDYFDIRYVLEMFCGAAVDFVMSIWVGFRTGEWEGWVAFFSRFLWMIILPGVGFHNTRNYINAVKWAKVTYKPIP